MTIYLLKAKNFKEYYTNKETAEKIRNEWNDEAYEDGCDDYIKIEEINVIED